MSEYISRDKLKKKKKYSFQTVFGVFPKSEWFYKYEDVESIPSADVRENIHGTWERMSDLPEDKDDRYKCSRCGNVVHHASGVNLYTFNSWCGACGSLNNSLIAGLEPIGEKGTE